MGDAEINQELKLIYLSVLIHTHVHRKTRIVSKNVIYSSLKCEKSSDQNYETFLFIR